MSDSTNIPLSHYLPTDAPDNDEESEKTEVVETDELQDFLDEMEEIEAALKSEPEPEPAVDYIDPLQAAATLSQKIHDDSEAVLKQDNVEAAMDKLAETLDPKISTKISDDDGPADKQILIRSTQKDHERWKVAAEREGKSLSGFIRDIVNLSVTEILDCSHPEEYRQRYPWKETCLKCDTTLWQKVETHLENRR
jgi:predicted HicB family RNase H-like nuclease|tara:strand:+ start:86 stop:670 length:585 start_codon:yes stop_codon:yes gene_type:complete